LRSIELPDSLSWWNEMPGGSAWLAELPQLARECAEIWHLDLGPPFAGSNASLVIPAGDVVLKLNPPEDESEHEPDALRVWDGGGAVQLHAYDAARRALLVERCVPGTTLLETDDDTAGDVVTGLLPRLWKPPTEDMRRLADVATHWVDELPRQWERYGRPFEGHLLAAAVGALRELGPTQGELVVANEDLHAGNVLRSRREPWLVIDPKPLAAERDFTPVAMVRDRMEDVVNGPRPLDRLRRRLDRFSSDLDLDRERLKGWTVAHTIAWGFDPSEFHATRVGLARLLLDA
jgi:streptomycin 6-kinase